MIQGGIKMKLKVKLFLIVMLLLCLLKMPFGYFQLVRILGILSFGYLAYWDFKEKIKYTPQIFIVLAAVFNPIIKVSFSRDLWQIVDVISAVIVGVTILIENRLKASVQEE